MDQTEYAELMADMKAMEEHRRRLSRRSFWMAWTTLGAGFLTLLLGKQEDMWMLSLCALGLTFVAGLHWALYLQHKG